MTPREIVEVLTADASRHRREIEEARQLNHEMAVLMTYAFHRPAKMPKYKPLKIGGSKKHPDLIDAEAVYARHVFKRWAKEGRP